MTLSEADSIRSGNSETSTAVEATERLLRKRHGIGATHGGDVNDDGEEGDLMEQNKTLQEAVFSAMYVLSRSRTADSWRWAALKLVLEGLVPFLVVFNPRHWPIDNSNPVWQVARWAQPATPVAAIWGYRTYVHIFYALVGLIFSVVAAIGVLTAAMRKQGHSRRLLRFGKLLQRFTEALFNIAYVAVFDYIMFFFNCRFGAHGHPHYFWPDVQCLSGRHMILMAISAVTAIAFFITTALMLVASCDLNPIAGGIMASPAAVTRLQVLTLKALFVLAAETMVAAGKAQAIVLLVLALGICWLSFRTLPFLRLYVNDVWVGVWVAVSFMCTVHVVMDLSERKGDDAARQQAKLFTNVVLYGIFPAMLLGAALTAMWSRWRLRPAEAFRGLDAVTARQRRLYTFTSPTDVEVVARAMRHFDLDGIILEEAAQLGETIIKCGMAAFPGDVGLLILTANYLMEVKRDGPAARTQLQLALKGGPSLIQRYQIFSTIENSKRLKDGQEGQLDLQSYVEFKRNYRAVIRMHKSALAAQRDVWQLMQHSTVRASTVDAALMALDAAADAAQRVYRRVLERYPNNGKLLRCYGKFLEDVRNDPVAASRVYTEAARNGGADELLSLDLKIQGTDKPEFLTSMDLHEDACVVINAEGKILMVNACVTTLLGYPRAELEGANVSVIMPQPFSTRHPGYISRYIQDGDARILDTVRDFVALHKDRYVFPVQLCVTKLSGAGTDAIFLGLLRPQPPDSRNVRAWVAPNGVILCTDPQFASLTGMLGEEMVGRNFRALCTDIAAVDSLLEVCRTAPYEKLLAGEISINLEMAHRYLSPLPVQLTVRASGTDMQRILVMNAQRINNCRNIIPATTMYVGGGITSTTSTTIAPDSSSSSSCSEGLMVLDHRGALVFATWDVAAMLGFPLRSFLRMKLEQLLPEPFATLHTAKYLRDPPATIPPVSCRAGRLVHLVNSNGSHIPVRLKISTKDDEGLTGGGAGGSGGGSRTRHIIQVSKVDATNAAVLHADKRLVLLCSMDGRVLSVDQPTSTLFGFTASACLGSNLADCVDVFEDWRTKAGAHQLELLLLSLLDKEAEMPGTSWRVKVHSPEHEEGMLAATSMDAKTSQVRRPMGRSACLQTELVESGIIGSTDLDPATATAAAASFTTISTTTPMATASAAGIAGAAGRDGAVKIMARIILWRRDVLTGVVELDDQLNVRKADVGTGLIVGMPSTSLPRTPLSRLLDINKGMSWDDLMLSDRRKHKPSALKGSTTAIVSEPRAFIGPHPDGGTMRIVVQGVSFVSGGRIVATLHPDTSYVGARANLYRALGLETIIHQQQQHHQQQQDQQLQQATETLQLRRPASRAVLPRSDSVIAHNKHQLEQFNANNANNNNNNNNNDSNNNNNDNSHQSSGNNHTNREMEVQKGRGHRAAEEGDPPGVVEAVGALKHGGMNARKKGNTASATALSMAQINKDDPEVEVDKKDEGGGAAAAAGGVKRTDIYDDVDVGDGDGNGDGDNDGDVSGDAGRDTACNADDDGDDGDDDDGDDEEEEDEEAEEEKEVDKDGTKLHVRAHSQSEFVESWVRSLSRQMTAARNRNHNSAAPSKEPSRKFLTAGQQALPSASAPSGTFAAFSQPHSRANGGGADDHTRTLLVRASTKLVASGLCRPGSSASVPDASIRRRTADPPPFDPLADDVPDWDSQLQDSPMDHFPLRGFASDYVDVSDSRTAVRTADDAAGDDGGNGGGGGDEVRRMLGGHLGCTDEAAEREGSRSRDGRRGTHVSTPIGGSGGGGVGGGGGGGGGGSSIGDDDDDGSQGAGGGRSALSDFTSGTEIELTTDARRSRLLKKMAKVLSGPTLELSLSRLRSRTLLLLTGMLTTHVICYIVLMGLINLQYSHVHEIHRVALAADRCQVTTLKASVAEFCSRPGVEPVSFCEASLDSTLRDLRAALDDLESYHQSVYLGTTTVAAGGGGGGGGGGAAGQTPKKIAEGELYDIWTNPVVTYQLYMDVDPGHWLNVTVGIWQLGNRFLSTGREVLYWGQRLGGNISHLRSFKFLQANGPWSVFQSYTISLDYLAHMTWDNVDTLQHRLLIIFIIEAVAVQLSCIVYEFWLVRLMELRRRGTLLVPLGLPGPVLRLLSNRPLVVVEGSEDDEADSVDGGVEGLARDFGIGEDGEGNDDGGHDVVFNALVPSHRGAVHTTRQRALIDFAPLRRSAEMMNLPTDKVAAAAVTTNGGGGAGTATHGSKNTAISRTGIHQRLQQQFFGDRVHTTYHRNARATIDFAPLRSEVSEPMGHHHNRHIGGAKGGGAATTTNASSTTSAPTLKSAPLLRPPSQRERRDISMSLIDADDLPLDPSPMRHDHSHQHRKGEQEEEDVESERAAPVRHDVMMLANIGGGGSAGGGASSGATGAGADEEGGSTSGTLGGRRGGGSGGVPAVVNDGRSASRLAVNGKHLIANSRSMLTFLVPLVLWEAALATVGALSYFWLQNMQGPLASLNMASHVIYRYTRVRMLALLLVAGSDTVARSHWRNVLTAELANLRDEYDTLLYGGIASTQEGSVFQKPVPASTFESASFATNFFREQRCFRWDQSKCYTPDNPYYEVTHHGLDSMMRRVVSELELLAADDDSDAVYNSTRYITMYMVGTKDLYEGLQSSAQLFVDYMIGRYQNVKLLHTLLLVATVVLFLSYAVFVLRPYIAAVAREAHRLAGLLSHVPGEFDVVSYTRQVMKAAAHAMGTDTGSGDSGSGTQRRRSGTTDVAPAGTAAAAAARASEGNDEGGSSESLNGPSARDRKQCGAGGGGGGGGGAGGFRRAGTIRATEGVPVATTAGRVVRVSSTT